MDAYILLGLSRYAFKKNQILFFKKLIFADVKTSESKSENMLCYCSIVFF